jgi:hypothetical protein
MNDKKPNFLIVGVQKAGTTYLCGRLAKNNDVFFSDPKELLFFQKKDISQQEYEEYLEKYFSNAQNEKFRGEGSTVYLQWPYALENIQKYLGNDLKIIVCLRQPTDRALSFYLHNYKKGRFDGSESILDVGGDIKLSPVLSSMYAPHIERWLKIYGDNISFQLFDDLLESPSDFVRQASKFLGIEAMEKVSEVAVNKGYSLIWKDGLLTLNVEKTDKKLPTFTMEELEKLHSLFQDDIEKTEKLIGKSLSHWKKMPEFTAKQKNW